MIKAVFIDFDGTIADSNRKVSRYTKNAIKKCVDKGIKIILTSGRSRYVTLQIKNEIGSSGVIISSNGANAFDANNDIQIYSNPINIDELNKLYEYVVDNDYTIALNHDSYLSLNHKRHYNDGNNIVKTSEEIKEIINQGKVVQCVVSNSNVEKMRKFKDEFYNIFKTIKIENQSLKINDDSAPSFDIYYCDIANESVSKGNAVEAVCEFFNYKKEEVAAIGDSYNDISMLKIVGTPVAMGNAVEDVKKIAKIITDTNDNNGAAKYLETLI